MNNIDIREEVKKSRIRWYEIAERMGIADCSLSRKLRKELTEDEKEKIRQIIADFKREENT